MTSTAEWDQRELILVLGDFHIPHRTEDIPDQFKTLLQPGRVSQVICTGNLCSLKSTEDFIRKLGGTTHFVKGDLDTSLTGSSEFPETKQIRVGELQIGIIHGHQLVPWGDTEMLYAQARSMNVDVLVTGHTHVAGVLACGGERVSGAAAAGTGKSSTSTTAASSNDATATSASSSSTSAAVTTSSTLLINPGSVTGAFSPFTTSVVPSFALLAIQGSSVTVYQYELPTPPPGISAAKQEVTVTKTEWRKGK